MVWQQLGLHDGAQAGEQGAGQTAGGGGGAGIMTGGGGTMYWLQHELLQDGAHTVGHPYEHIGCGATK